MKERAIGLMSGTSLDGLDAVLIERGSQKVKILSHRFAPYSSLWKKEIRKISSENQLKEGSLFSALWAEHAAKTVKKLLKKARISNKTVKVIGAHGQTVGHFPKLFITIQLGDLSRLAIRTGIPVVGNFRLAD